MSGRSGPELGGAWSGTGVAFEAMVFACEAHRGQLRKYTSNPYSDHLAEVAGVALSSWSETWGGRFEVVGAVCWLHDCIDDQQVGYEDLVARFGLEIAGGVLSLSDYMDQGNRTERKAAARQRLAAAPGWVQSIKCADSISNMGSIAIHDPAFAAVYLPEIKLLLDVLGHADARLLSRAKRTCAEQLAAVGR